LTLESNKTWGLVSIWYVSAISLSHHKYISFKVGDLEATRVTYQGSKKANLESYQKDLQANLMTDMVQQAILSPSPKLYSQSGLLAKEFLGRIKS